MKLRKNTARLAAGAALAGTALALATPAFACSEDDYTGTICMTAASYCPEGTVEVQGQTVAIVQQTALYSLMGVTYGGDGHNTFKYPDLRSRSPVGASNSSGFGGLDPIAWGQYVGQETIQLTENTMPAHVHGATFTPDTTGVSVSVPVSANTATTQNDPDVDHSFLAGAPAGGAGQAYIWSSTEDKVTTVGGVTVSGGAETGTVTVGSTGAGHEFFWVPPQLGIRFCLVTTGIYPPRP